MREAVAIGGGDGSRQPLAGVALRQPLAGATTRQPLAGLAEVKVTIADATEGQPSLFFR